MTPSELVKATFSGRWVFWAEGDRVRIPPPAWLGWPMVRGDEFAPQSPVTPKAKRK